MTKETGPDPLFDAEEGRRSIRSFVLRGGRLTRAQARALQTLWPIYGIPNEHSQLDLAALFERPAPVVLEIGFGDGSALAEAAAEDPERNYLGVEVYQPGVGSLLLAIQANGLENVRVLCADAVGVLENRIPPGSLDEVRLYFPDPWPKKRHHKRRIVQPHFVEQVFQSLAPGGVFHLATDWENYAEHMLEVLEKHPGLRNRAGSGAYSETRAGRPKTKFERRGQQLGHPVWDLLYERPA